MNKLTKHKGDELRKDTKSYYVAAVLDRAESERMMRPLPKRLELMDKDEGQLTVPSPSSKPAKDPMKPGYRLLTGLNCARWDI